MNIAIERYGAEIKNGGSAAHDVERDPGVAETWTEDPVSEKVVDASKGHHQTSHEEVGDGEGGQEQIANPPEASVRVYRYADQDVPRNRQEYQDEQQETCLRVVRVEGPEKINGFAAWENLSAPLEVQTFLTITVTA